MAKPYDDGAGDATVGYGHLILEGEDYSGGITEAEAAELFRQDVERVVNPALDRITIDLTQNQVDALGSFIFNAGSGAFAKARPSMSRKANCWASDEKNAGAVSTVAPICASKWD